MSVGVPNHVGAIFINAEQGNVEVEKLRGPFIIQASGGDVHLKNVMGRGLIRTTAGNITLAGVGGDVHLVTLGGAITVFGSYAGKADVQSGQRPIAWRFAHMGSVRTNLRRSKAPFICSSCRVLPRRWTLKAPVAV